MDHYCTVSRRRLLGLATASSLAGAGCLGLDTDADEPVPTPTEPGPTPTPTPTPTLPPVEINEWDFAAEVDDWAWFPSDETRWSRSNEPYNDNTNDGRWMAWPDEFGGIRCLVADDDPPGNAGFYVGIGPIGWIDSITISSETRTTSDASDQSLVVAIYLDADDDGEFFEWEPADDRETFVGFGDDVELLGTVQADTAVTIDDDTPLDLVPPLEEEVIVTLGDVKDGAVDEVDDRTAAAVQVSVMGSGDGHTEEVTIHGVAASYSRLAQAGPEDWPMFRFGRHNLGYSHETTGPKGDVTAAWTAETDGPIHSSPAVVDGTVYVGSDDGGLHALDTTNGDTIWSYMTDGPIRSSPAVLGRLAYVGSDDHQLHAVDIETGDRFWAHETGGRVRSSPVVHDHWSARAYPAVVGVGSDDEHLWAFHGLTGDVYRAFESDGPVRASPMFYDQITTRGPLNHWFVWACTDGYVYWWKQEREREVGHEIGPQQYTSDGAIHTSPVAIPETGIQFHGTDAGTFHGYFQDHEHEWEFEADGPIRSSCALDHRNDRVVFGSDDGIVYGLEMTTGDDLWHVETGDRVRSSPALADGTVYIGCDDGRVLALSAEDGSLLWDYETGGAVSSSPAVVDGVVYVGSLDGRVYALTDD